MPNLAADLEPLRHLTRKNVAWNWTPACEKSVQTVKNKISQPPVLAYLDPSQTFTLQVDSSKDGLGAVSLQNDKPIEFASHASTKPEQNWVQIEKEILAVVYGLERFDQYTYGRNLVVQDDHSPLEFILKKTLSQAPKRLQALIMRLHKYDITFQHVPGRSLVLADTLSRVFPTQRNSQEHCVHAMNTGALPDIPDQRLQEIRHATETNEEARQLLQTIRNGWPPQRDQPRVRPYFSFRDTLSHDNGLIVKGERIFIPFPARAQIEAQLHSAHLGYDSMLRRARDTMFWIGMRNDIKQLADNCDVCQQTKPTM